MNLFVARDGVVHIKADGFDAVHAEVSVDEDLSWEGGGGEGRGLEGACAVGSHRCILGISWSFIVVQVYQCLWSS